MSRGLRSVLRIACAVVVPFFAVLGAALGQDILIVSFTPPLAWATASPDFMSDHPGMLGAWYAPVTGSSGFRQNINVFRFAAPQGVALADIVGNSVRAMQNSSNIVFIKHGLNARCARSSQIVSEEYSSNGVNMFIEQVMTIADGRLFVATYTREQGELRSPEAERAVEAMCPLSSA